MLFISSLIIRKNGPGSPNSWLSLFITKPRPLESSLIAQSLPRFAIQNLPNQKENKCSLLPQLKGNQCHFLLLHISTSIFLPIAPFLLQALLQLQILLEHFKYFCTFAHMGKSPNWDSTALKRGPWTPEEDQKLLAYVQQHGHGSWRSLPQKAGLLFHCFNLYLLLLYIL